MLKRRPRLAYPFTILTGPNTVRLVAGEDFRYTLNAPELETWLPPLLERCRGKETLQVILAALPPAQGDAALQVIGHLYGERVLVDGSASDAHVAVKYRVVIEGQGPLRDMLEGGDLPGGTERELVIHCQDRLDYDEALRINSRCRESGTPLLWASCGAMSRAYVSPLFLPDAGPCFHCLLRSFQRLSPAPEIYDALREHARQRKPIAAVDFPHEGLLMLQGVILWKLQEAERENPDAALYRLHVLEREHFEVSTHRVFIDAGCPDCGKERR